MFWDKLINIKLGNKNIARCGYGLQEESVVCLLGLNIDENLDWKIHVKKVEKRYLKEIIHSGDMGKNWTFIQRKLFMKALLDVTYYTA